jgi:hypothetical protein
MTDAFDLLVEHASQLTTHAHDMTTTTDVLLRMTNRPDGDKLEAIYDCLQVVLQQVALVFHLFI